ncbi:MAG: enoyl-CoA hydratase-related protein [Actinobacteria bacterium]|nr:enoyl-CoA hydratase-related protein [Actinomycetota bacterium]
MSQVMTQDVDGVRRLVLNRPDKLNALSAELVDTLCRRILETADDSEVRVVVIAGAGRSFCAGYDLTEGDDDPATTLQRSLDRLLEVFDLPQPVIAEVQGHCLAGGCDLMMMCDLAVAADDAVFAQPEIRFGAAIVAHVMPWLIGARRAKELVLTGDQIDAETASRIGLVNRVVPRDRLTTETMGLAARLALVDPRVMRLTKRAVNRSWEIAGFRQAIREGADLGSTVETDPAPERSEFERIRREAGLGEAVKWRDERYTP